MGVISGRTPSVPELSASHRSVGPRSELALGSLAQAEIHEGRVDHAHRSQWHGPNSSTLHWVQPGPVAPLHPQRACALRRHGTDWGSRSSRAEGETRPASRRPWRRGMGAGSALSGRPHIPPTSRSLDRTRASVTATTIGVTASHQRVDPLFVSLTASDAVVRSLLTTPLEQGVHCGNTSVLEGRTTFD